MASKEILEYYADTENRETRQDLLFAVNLIDQEKVAIDCGCGAGADVAFLREKGFRVFAFDIEEESVRICRERFKRDDKVFLSQDSFSTYIYPKSSLVVADASLFFCPEKDFDHVWEKIYQALNPNGVFCGSFLGPNDTMASSNYDKDAYWQDVLVFTEKTLRSKLEKFEILKFTEHELSGETASGEPHQWHIFSVVARKPAKATYGT